jgi:hypothetical protein
MALYPPYFQRYIGYGALISFYRKESTLPFIEPEVEQRALSIYDSFSEEMRT